MRLLALLLACAVSASAAELTLVRVFTGWRDAASFKRISEYFNGREDTGGEIVVRTQPAVRDGYYFLVRTQNAGAPVDAKLVFHVVLPDSPAPKPFAFTARIPSGSAVLNLGITGADWPARDVVAAAWKLQVLGPAGDPLAVSQSYLWENPGK